MIVLSPVVLAGSYMLTAIVAAYVARRMRVLSLWSIAISALYVAIVYVLVTLFNEGTDFVAMWGRPGYLCLAVAIAINLLVMLKLIGRRDL